MTKEELWNEIKRLAVCYGEKFEMSQSKFDLWYELTHDLNKICFHEAVSRHMATSEFPPLPANIIRHYKEVKEEWSMIMKHTWDTFNLASDNYMVYGGIIKVDDKEAFKDAYLRGKPYSDREQIAENFLQELAEYLNKHDKNAEDNHLPPFEEYIRGKR